MKSGETAEAPGVGVHYGLSFEEYLAIPAINKGGLDLIAKSPAHYWVNYLDPNLERRDDTPAKRHGRAIHHAVLEPDLFAKTWVQKPVPAAYPGYLNTAEEFKIRCLELGLAKSGSKAELKERILAAEKNFGASVLRSLFFEDVEDRLFGYAQLSEDEFAACLEIAERISQSDTAAEVFPKGRAEVTIIWRDKITGHLAKGRVDWLSDDFTVATDLKSSEDASRDGFAHACADYNYHRQADWYLEGIEAATGVRPAIFNFVVYEKKPPFGAGFYYASQLMVELGRMENTELMRRYDRCVRNGFWPGYSEELLPVAFPKWRLLKPDYAPEMENY